MENEEVILTQEGYEKLEQQLEYLKTTERTEIAGRIKIALGYGDLSENSEYDEAKTEQAQVEMKIVELENTLRNAKVIDEDEVDTERISIGCKVKVKDMELKEELEYKIVGSTEANSIKGKISNESPVGRALLGAVVGDTVTVHTPAGESNYKVLEIVS